MKGRSREEWEEMARNRETLCQLYTDGYGEWGGTARSIIDAVQKNKDTLYLWPYLRMAKLKRWFSPTGRVVIMGDAAHALPPSSGQGVNQTLEDVYALTRLLEKTGVLLEGGTELVNVLEYWQEIRQKKD